MGNGYEETSELLELGLQKLRNGNKRDAIACFSQAIELDSIHLNKSGQQYDAVLAKVYNYRGEAQFDYNDTKNEHNKLREASIDFTHAMQLDATYERPIFNFGRIMFVYGNKDSIKRAINYFNSSLKINPYLAEAYLWNGMAYSELGDNTKALRYFNKALNLKISIKLPKGVSKKCHDNLLKARKNFTVDVSFRKNGLTAPKNKIKNTKNNFLIRNN